MKTLYPNYKGNNGIDDVEANLNDEDKNILRRFLDVCGATANDYKVKCRRYEILQVRDVIEKPFNEWIIDDIISFLNLLKRSDRKDWTKKCVLTTLGKFIRWHYKDWFIRFNGLETLKLANKRIKPNTQNNYVDLPTNEEIDQLIRKGESHREKAYIALISEAGLPPKVSVNLRWKDFKFDFPKEGITSVTYFRTKNNEIYEYPLGETATYYLKMWKQEYSFPNVRESDYVFPQSLSRDKHVHENQGWYWLKKSAKIAGITKPIYQYILRHKALSDAYSKLPEAVHRQIFGHTKNSRMTETYNHTRRETAINVAIEKLHKVQIITKEQQNKYDLEIAELKSKIKTFEHWQKMQEDFRKYVLSNLQPIKGRGYVLAKKWIEGQKIQVISSNDKVIIK